METEFDALSVESDEESAGALIRRSSKVKSGINLNGNNKNKTLNMEAEADEVSSLTSHVEVAENTVESGKENCSRREVKTGEIKEAEPSEITCFEETVCREKEELLGPEVSNGHFFSLISSNGTAVMTMPTNSTEADKTQPKVMSECSESFVKEEGLWKCHHCSWVYPVMNPRIELIQKHKEHCHTMNNIPALFEKGFCIEHKIQEGYECRVVLDKEGEVIDYENKDTELVKDEKVIQTMTEVNENQTSVSEIITHNSQNGFVKAQNETRLSDHWSRTLENSASTGKVEEIVRVLKEQQSHDLLCPACGSCITKRVILRKRKRISTVSVDRWIQTPDDDAQAALLEGGQQITEDENGQPEISHEDSDETEAYGCLACFSIFFRRVVGVQHLLAKSESVQESLADQDPSSVLQDTRDISNKEKESFYWLPFQNPWRKNSKKEPRPGDQLKDPLLVEPKNEALDKKVSRALEESSSYGTLHSDKDVTLSQQLGDQLKGPLLVEPKNEALDKKVSRALEESSSYGTLHSDKDVTRSQQLGDQFKEPLLVEPKKEALDKKVLRALEESSSYGTLHSDKDVTRSQQLAAAKELRSSLSHEVKDSYGVATQSIGYQTSITETKTLTVLSSMENAGIKETKYTLTESTNITGSDKSSQLEEQFLPAKRSEDQLAELHLYDSARLHAKREEQKHAKTEAPDGYASIISPDLLLSNIETSIKENVGSKKTNYTLTEATNISQYVNESDKSSQMKEQFSAAKRSEDQLEDLHLDDTRLHAKREEQEHANTKTPDGGVSIILPDVLPSNIKTNIPQGIHEDSATYDRESDNFSAVPRDEELQQDTAAQKDDSYKTDYMCNCIPISIQRVWSICSLKESITDEQLKEPLLTKGKLEKNVSMLPDGSVSHDILQSDDKESEGTSPLLSARVESSGLLTKRDPTPLHSEKTAISTDVTVTAVQTVIEVEPIDDSQPYDVATTVPESTRTTTTEPQARQIVTEWDVLKSIVYGGLTVSLTSLGVVSSTAGGDAKTLTVIAIGLSNLVAGLFVILNNIVDLDHYHKDQFIARVGHSSWFNGSLAIVSYLIFGSLAAITYAFSFRKSDDRLYKFIATSAVSMVCIILLALGKARISKKSYIRTVTLYIVTGFWSAVAGFFAGEYIKKLLEKWGL